MDNTHRHAAHPLTVFRHAHTLNSIKAGSYSKRQQSKAVVKYVKIILLLQEKVVCGCGLIVGVSSLKLGNFSEQDNTHAHIQKRYKWCFLTFHLSVSVCWMSFSCFLQEVQTEPVLNALRDTRKNRRCKIPKESLPSAHLPINEHQGYSKSESCWINILLLLHRNPTLSKTQFSFSVELIIT